MPASWTQYFCPLHETKMSGKLFLGELLKAAFLYLIPIILSQHQALKLAAAATATIMIRLAITVITIVTAKSY